MCAGLLFMVRVGNKIVSIASLLVPVLLYHIIRVFRSPLALFLSCILQHSQLKCGFMLPNTDLYWNKNVHRKAIRSDLLVEKSVLLSVQKGFLCVEGYFQHNCRFPLRVLKIYMYSCVRRPM